MRIVFNLKNVGLGNNGGSRTIIKCAETLKTLGHEIFLYAPVNKYSWQPIEVEITKKIPRSDILIATGYRSVVSTLQAKRVKKFYYVRGFELWQAGKEKLLRSYNAFQGNCLVNSEWLHKYMTKNKIKSHLIYPGLDFKDFYNYGNNREPIIGGIFSSKHSTKRHGDVIAIGEKLKCKTLLLNRDIKRPSITKMRDFYNKIKIWISPSELEGLHNCPMEAGLCGCGIVTTDSKRGGVSDYAIHQNTALTYPARDILKASGYVKQLLDDGDLLNNLNNNMVAILNNKIGNRLDNMKKMVSIFEKTI